MKISRFAVLVAGVVILLFAGIIYAWSILKAPFMTEFGWDASALGINFTVMICCFVLGGMLGGVLQSRIKPYMAMWIATVLAFVGFFLTSRMSGESIMSLYIFYGVLCGLGIGIVYNVVISSVSKLFPDMSTTASGVLMMGFGTSTLVLGSVAGILLEDIGWRSTFLTLAVVAVVIFAVGSFFIAAAGRISIPESNKVPENKTSAGSVAQNTVVDVPTGEMIRKPLFWKFYVYQILIAGIGTCVISVAKDVSVAVGNTETLAILMVGVLSVCNGIGRVIGGLFFDKVGRRQMFFLAAILAIVATAICLVSILFNIALLNTVGLVVIGLMYGFMPSASSGFARSVFGSKYFSLNFSMVNSMLAFASFSSTIGGGLYQSSGNFVSVFVMLLCFALAATGLFLSFRKQV